MKEECTPERPLHRSFRTISTDSNTTHAISLFNCSPYQLQNRTGVDRTIRINKADPFRLRIGIPSPVNGSTLSTTLG